VYALEGGNTYIGMNGGRLVLPYKARESRENANDKVKRLFLLFVESWKSGVNGIRSLVPHLHTLVSCV